MSRLLVILLLAVAAYLLIRGLARLPGKSRDARGDAAPDGQVPERMVRCARCGVHVPERDSVRAGDRHYCSEEHRRLG